jgi:hypothetical protein
VKNEKGMLTRYLLGSGTIRMNILLDQRVPCGSRVTLKDDSDLGPDAGLEWEVLERYETLEVKQADRVMRNRKWDNNI